MSERLTDEQLREWRGSLDAIGKPIAADDAIAFIDEALALRGRVARLEAALKAARPYVKGMFDQLAFTNEQHLRGRGLERLPASMLSMIDAALKDAPQ